MADQPRRCCPSQAALAICGGIAANIPAGVTTDQRGYPIKNTTYPGYSSSTPCVDSGAVQTNYAMAITTQPPANATVNEAIAPAPVVTLTESGNMAGSGHGHGEDDRQFRRADRHDLRGAVVGRGYIP